MGSTIRGEQQMDGMQFGRELAQQIKHSIKQPTEAAIAALEARIAALETRVDELQTASGELRYVGTWRDGREYQRGNFTTANGSLWHCEQPTRSRPGTDSTWKLAVKKGTAT
jgi:hypothetical protein